MTPDDGAIAGKALGLLLAHIDQRFAELQTSVERLQRFLVQDDVLVIDRDRFMLALQRKWAGPNASWTFPESVEEALKEATVAPRLQ